jgi:hypothetical protein
VAENKNIKLPAKWTQWWLQILDIAASNGKDALLRIDPTNIPTGSRKHVPEMHIISAERHGELLRLAELGRRYQDLTNS